MARSGGIDMRRDADHSKQRACTILTGGAIAQRRSTGGGFSHAVAGMDPAESAPDAGAFSAGGHGLRRAERDGHAGGVGAGNERVSSGAWTKSAGVARVSGER